MLNLFAPPSKPDREDIARVKAWVYEVFALPDDIAVTVMELTCADADCPDVETVVGILGPPGQSRRHKLLKPVANVTQIDILSLAARGTHG